ncbi:MAG: transglutaminase family protein [Oscillospiraceae bacterium]|nr:transglutaminase family protein [Oscillospiraceae bacterium]
MKKVNFSFETKLTFDDYVHDHSFALRIIPPETPKQHIVSCNLRIAPPVATCQTCDAFGNNVTAGYIREDHRFLDFEIKGSAEIDTDGTDTGYMPCYLYQSEYTAPDEALRGFYNEIKEKCPSEDITERVTSYCDIISDTVEYKKGITDTNTKAPDVFALKAGVCQDFSHLLISILRMDGIAARYAAGLAFCDGETHSWVEYWNKDRWEGFDPANNCPVNDGYLVLSHGRDFRDCSIDRGIMFGRYTKQLQLVRSVLT